MWDPGQEAAWRAARHNTVSRLRDLGRYLDTLHGLAELLAELRARAAHQAVAAVGPAVYIAVRVTAPFLVAGLGLGAASLLARLAGGDTKLGWGLALTAAALEVWTAGAASPVVAAGAGLWWWPSLLARCGRAVLWTLGGAGLLAGAAAALLRLSGPALQLELRRSSQLRAAKAAASLDCRLAGELNGPVVSLEWEGDICTEERELGGKAVRLGGTELPAWLAGVQIHWAPRVRLAADQLEEILLVMDFTVEGRTIL